MASLVHPPGPGILVVHPADVCWMDAVLRLLTFHLCLGTGPLNQCDAVVLFLQHLLILAHPVPLALGPRERPPPPPPGRQGPPFPLGRGDTDEALMPEGPHAVVPDPWPSLGGGPQRSPAPRNFSFRGLMTSASNERLITGGGGPQASYLSLAAAVTQVVIRCFDARRWASDASLIQRGFRLHEKTSVAGCTVMVYVQRRQTAEPFSPPLKAIRGLEVSVDGGDEIIGPLRDSKTGGGPLTFSFSGVLPIKTFMCPSFLSLLLSLFLSPTRPV